MLSLRVKPPQLIVDPVSFGLSLSDAVYAASTAPAGAAGLADVGAIEVGRRADFVVLDEKLSLKAVFVDGERILL